MKILCKLPKFFNRSGREPFCVVNFTRISIHCLNHHLNIRADPCHPFLYPKPFVNWLCRHFLSPAVLRIFMPVDGRLPSERPPEPWQAQPSARLPLRCKGQASLSPRRRCLAVLSQTKPCGCAGMDSWAVASHRLIRMNAKRLPCMARFQPAEPK